MHVADLSVFYSSTGGGISRYLNAKRAWCKRFGINHTLVAPKGAGLPNSSTHVQVRSVPLAHGYRLPLGSFGVRRTLEQRGVDIIELGDPYLFVRPALDLRRRTGIPVVGFCHSDPSAIAARYMGPAGRRVADRWLRRVYGAFDLVLAPSRQLAERLDNIGVERIRMQPLGVDTALFHPVRRDARLRRSLSLPSDTRVLVFAGRLAPEKSLPVLAEAMRILGPHYFLLLIGQGPVTVRGPNIRSLPHVRDSLSLARLIASADLFVHPGTQETFGLAALEAMACGVPVVGTRAGGIAEIVSENCGVVARPGNAESFAAAIATAYERGLETLGTAARERATLFDWDRIFPMLIAQYEGVLGSAVMRRALQTAVA